MVTDRELTIAALDAGSAEAAIPALGALLHACVQDGASIGFVLPFEPAEAEAFWRTRVLPEVAAGTRLLLVAREGGRIAGSAQLFHGTPANQPHRAEVAKLLVDPACRRRGIARALMAELETAARGLGRSLLTLDTRTGDSAEPLYASLGFATAGVIPGYCLDARDRRLDSTTIMYKAL
ncbi:Ribosomal protein S18 acetylase RimI [Tistlia consotensis]|uniref:Ribosomal protein S18 acetylase RimI n=1 Tax=Tistlia consotensis USBA 355 TaxID=560819 RepID=A0A1Y6CA77_9PROT|nr:GNAT family N-acetyltransferase [Tistlia consotensis]SMF53836.1 Ribosomal protein S18 acetylase RimI [Tistlia consotensis USBA 355]SNR86110.1 Ribosomal protein S18 acetylase RimI [Tistlia consotensis]